MELSPSSHCTPLQNPSLRAMNFSFKRENRRKKKERKHQEKLQQLMDDWNPLAHQNRPVTPIAPSATVIEWPLDPVADQNPDLTSWSFKHLPSSSSTVFKPPVAAEEVAHQYALKSCREFFALDDDCDEEDGEEDDDDSNNDKNFQFFKTLFEKEGDIRDVYQRDWEKGDFTCLVCGGAGEKLGKRFIGLSGLVQHANFISKTKRRVAHRAYARVVCKLLGWEIDKLDGSTIDHGDGDDQSQAALGDWVNNQNEAAQDVDAEDAGVEF